MSIDYIAMFAKPQRKKRCSYHGRTKAMKAYMERHPFCEAKASEYYRLRGTMSEEDLAEMAERKKWRRSEHCHHVASRRFPDTDNPADFLALSNEAHDEYHDSWRRFTKKYKHLKKKILAARAKYNLSTELDL